MHWTQLLAYNRYPEHAMIADDLHCLGCGYNVRGLRVHGRCPECGRAVRDSLVLLTQPARVAAALATIGKSYLGLYGVAILLLAARVGSNLLVWFTFTLLACCVLLRCVGALELRFLSGLQHRPQLTGRVELLWWVILIEFLATMALLGMWMFGVVRGIEIGSLVWAIATLFSIIAAGRSGIGLAQVLEYDSLIRELWVQQILVAASLILGLLGAAARLAVTALPAGNATGMDALVALVFVLAALTGIAAIFVTFTGLMHLSIAAHCETEPLDHLVSTDPSEITVAPPRPSQRTASHDDADVPLA